MGQSTELTQCSAFIRFPEAECPAGEGEPALVNNLQPSTAPCQVQFFFFTIIHLLKILTQAQRYLRCEWSIDLTGWELL